MDITHVNEVFAELTKKAACMAQKIALEHESWHPSNPEGEFQPPQRQVHIPEICTDLIVYKHCAFYDLLCYRHGDYFPGN